MLGHYIGPAPKNKEIGVTVMEAENGGSKEWYDTFVGDCAKRGHWATYNAVVSGGYDPLINWKELFMRGQ